MKDGFSHERHLYISIIRLCRFLTWALVSPILGDMYHVHMSHVAANPVGCLLAWLCVCICSFGIIRA